MLKKLAIVGVAGLLITGCSNSSDEDKANCLYAAMAAYPDWSEGQPRVTESVPECKDLSEADKQEIRAIWNAAAEATIRNLQKG